MTRALIKLAAKALLLLCAALPQQANAQELLERLHPTVDLDLDVRVDFLRADSLGRHGDNSGFHGRYLNLSLQGQLMPGLTYALQERINKLGEARTDAFAATDWVWLRYQMNPHWAVSAGKEIVLVGGYEYDAKPINEYFTSRFWNNFACFQFAATATWMPRAGHALSFQVSNSPFCQPGGSCYAYNLYWSGKMGPLQTLWSTNMIEYAPRHYVNYIALGNRLTLGDFQLDLDLMNRYTAHHHFIGGDYSVIAKATYAIRPWIRLMAKGGYDELRLNPGADSHVDNPFYGGGVEVFPFRNTHDVRLHAIWDRVSDNEGNRINEINVGLTWLVNFATPRNRKVA